MRHGPYVIYGRITDILRHGSYSNGKLQGLSTIYDKYGIVHQTRNYKKNKLHGLCTTYDFAGCKIKEAMYRHGMRNGHCTYYDSCGAVQSESTYRNGLLNGLKTYYASNEENSEEYGRPVAYLATGYRVEEVWEHGKRHGKMTVYDALGRLVKEYLYERGNLVSEVVVFHTVTE